MYRHDCFSWYNDKLYDGRIFLVIVGQSALCENAALLCIASLHSNSVIDDAFNNIADK